MSRTITNHKPGLTDILIQDIPTESKVAFKTACAQRKTSMKRACTLFFNNAGAVLPKLHQLEFRRKKELRQNAVAV